MTKATPARPPDPDRLYADQLAAQQAMISKVTRSPASLAKALDPTYRIRPHTRVISDAFTGLRDHDAGTGGHDRIMCVTPPQIGKSSTASMWAIVWWLIHHPRHRAAISSYSGSLAIKRGRDIRDTFAEHGHLFGLNVGTPRSAEDWSLNTGGGVRSVGVGGGLTGHSADILICDDPHKDRAEAESLTQRDRVDEWWSSTAITRLSPGAPAVLILTRWHPDDLAGRLLEREGRIEHGGRWKVVHMPAIADTSLTGPDPLERSDGDPITHPKIPSHDRPALVRHWQDKKSTVSVRDWGALFQGDPQPIEGALVSEALLRSQRHIPPPATPVKHVVAVDPSGGGRDTAGIIGGHLADDGRVYLTHDASVVGPSNEWGRAAAGLAADIGADEIVYESNYGGDTVKTVIRSAWDALTREHPDDERYQRIPPRVTDTRAKRGKYLRAQPVAQQFIDDRLRLGAYLADLEGEWVTWQENSTESPGRIDASVYLVHKVLPLPGSGAVISQTAGVSQDDIAARLAQKGPRRKIDGPPSGPRRSL